MPVLQVRPTILSQHTDHPMERTPGGLVRKEKDIMFRLDPAQASEWVAGDAERCAMVVGSGIPGIKVEGATPLILGQPDYVEAVWEQDRRLWKGMVVGTDQTAVIPLQVISVNDATRMRELVEMIGTGVDLLIVGVTSSGRRVPRAPEKSYDGPGGPVTRGQVKGRGCKAAEAQFDEIAKGTRAQLDRTVPADILASGEEAAGEYRARFASRVESLNREAQGLPEPRRSNRRAIKGRRPLS